MLKDFVISRDLSGGPILHHVVAANTYGAAPTLVTDGFYTKTHAGRSYDAFEFTYSFTGGDATSRAVCRVWFWIPDHDPASVGGQWLPGRNMENISLPGAATDVFSPVRRINSVPVASTRMYIQVVSSSGTAFTDLYFVAYGIEGIVANVDNLDISVETDVGDISVSAPFAQATHTTPVSFTSAFATANTISCVGSSFVIDEANCRVVYVLYRHAGGTWSAPLVNGIGGVSLTAAANVITLAGSAGAPLLAGDEMWVGVAQRPAAGGGGGAAGGGDSLYISPSDYTASYLNATQLTITGMPFSPTLAQWVSVYLVDVTGVGKNLSPETNTFGWDPLTGILTVGSAGFAATDTYRLMCFGPDKSYQQASDSKRIQEVAPLSAQNVWENLVLNAALGAATYYYPSSSGLNLSGYKSIAAQVQMGATAICTLEASIDVTATDWEDVSRAAWDMKSGASGVANWSGTTAMLDLESCTAPLVRFKVVVSAPAAVQIDVRRVAI